MTRPRRKKSPHKPLPFGKHAALQNYDWERALRKGLDMAMEAMRAGREADDADIMWALLQEAARVSRVAYRAPPSTSLPSKSAMPEAPPEVTEWQKISAYLRGELDEMPETESAPPRPSAEQVTRAGMVLEVWHLAALKNKGDWSRIRKAVYLSACGMPTRKITAVTGFSRQRLYTSRVDAMQDMADFVYGLYKYDRIA